MDHLCCQYEGCCECWLLPRGQISVYDPDNQDIEFVFRYTATADGLPMVERVNDDNKNDEVTELEKEI